MRSSNHRLHATISVERQLCPISELVWRESKEKREKKKMATTGTGKLSWWTNDIGGLFKGYEWSNDLSTWESIAGHALVMVAYAVLVKWFRARGGFKGFLTPEKVRSVRYCHSMGLSFVSLVMGVLMILHVYNEGRFDSWQDSACRVSPSV